MGTVIPEKGDFPRKEESEATRHCDLAVLPDFNETEPAIILCDINETEPAVLPDFNEAEGVINNKHLVTCVNVISHNSSTQGIGSVNGDIEPDFDSDDSTRDPNYIPESSNTVNVTAEVEDRENPSSNQKRKVKEPTKLMQKGKKRVRQEENWSKNEAKRLKGLGQSYKSFGKNKGIVAAKEMGPPCGENCRLKCDNKINDGIRRQIFQEFWNLGNTERQHTYISSCMESIKPQYRYPTENSPRNFNNAFYFDINGTRMRVCKTYFKSTLAITDRPIRTVLSKKLDCRGVYEDNRGKHGKHATVPPHVKSSIRSHIEKIPKLESHFCRAQTTRQYIEGSKTIKDLHRDYVEECKEQQITYGNYVMYSRIFNEEFNLSFFKPKKDQCELCTTFQNSNLEEKEKLVEEYESHILEKDLSRIVKQTDKESDDKEVIVYDLQAVLPCPLGQTSAFYYVSKLGVYNFTMVDMKTNIASCYVWNEAEANRGAEEIGSCVYKYLEEINEKKDKPTDIIFYSDNCTGQQKNQYLVSLYAYAVRKLNRISSIEHKYLITGHTQNKGDSVHSVIERQVKRARNAGPIFIPEQYYTLIRTAKKTGPPFIVNELTHKDFIGLKDLAKQQGINLKVPLKNIKIIKFTKESPGIMFYKASFGQHQYEEVMISGGRRKINNIQLKPAYQNKVGISDKKKAGLMSLIEKKSVPEGYSAFFKNL